MENRKDTNWQSKRDEFIRVLKNSNLSSQRIREELGDLQKGWENDEVATNSSPEKPKKEDLIHPKPTVETFPCNKCLQEKELDDFAEITTFWNNEKPAIRICEKCYHGGRSNEPKELQLSDFVCDICQQAKWKEKINRVRINGVGFDPYKLQKICENCIQRVDVIETREEFF
jgi:hypothetical protein